MKTLAVVLITISALLSGCVYHDDVRYRGDRDRDGVPNRVDRDRDGDRVPNTYDRRPDDPRRY